MKTIGIVATIVIIAIMICVGWYMYAGMEKLKVISVSTDIKAPDGTTLDIHAGIYGTLTVEGEIISANGGVAYVHFVWEADTEIPTNYVVGVIRVGNNFYECPIGPDGNQGWSGAEGENHIWKMDLKFHRDSTVVKHYIDGSLVKTNQYPEGYEELITGFTSGNDSREQVHISGAFTVKQGGSYEHANHVPTFYLIKDYADFYFSHNAIYVEY